MYCTLTNDWFKPLRYKKVLFKYLPYVMFMCTFFGVKQLETQMSGLTFPYAAVTRTSSARQGCLWEDLFFPLRFVYNSTQLHYPNVSLHFLLTLRTRCWCDSQEAGTENMPCTLTLLMWVVFLFLSSLLQFKTSLIWFRLGARGASGRVLEGAGESESTHKNVLCYGFHVCIV